jgi:hypothetical protein
MADTLRLDRNRKIRSGDFGMPRMIAPDMSDLNVDHCAVW